jgi:hypothetical protein
MCPRLDDRNGHITQGNNVLKYIANDENVHFIDNDQSMKNVNGAINITCQILQQFLKLTVKFSKDYNSLP